MPPEWRAPPGGDREPGPAVAAQIPSAADGRPRVVETGRSSTGSGRGPTSVLLACTGPVVAALAAARLFCEPLRPGAGHGTARHQRAGHRRAVLRRGATSSSCTAIGSEPSSPHCRLRHTSESGWQRCRSSVRAGPQDGDRQPDEPGLRCSGQGAARRADREEILLALADAGSAVVKLRAVRGAADAPGDLVLSGADGRPGRAGPDRADAVGFARGLDARRTAAPVDSSRSPRRRHWRPWRPGCRP